MKKLTTIIAILFSLSAFGQPPKMPPIPVPDSIVFINQKHIAEAVKKVDELIQSAKDKITLAEYQTFVQGINVFKEALVSIATEEYNKKQKPIKVPVK